MHCMRGQKTLAAYCTCKFTFDSLAEADICADASSRRMDTRNHHLDTSMCLGPYTSGICNMHLAVLLLLQFCRPQGLSVEENRQRTPIRLSMKAGCLPLQIVIQTYRSVSD